MKNGLLLLCLFPAVLFAQSFPKQSVQVGLSGGIANGVQSVSLAGMHLFNLFPSRRFELGYGLRVTSLFESISDYRCDCGKPAQVTPEDKVNHSINLMLHTQLFVLKRIMVGFNIDFAGLRFAAVSGGLATNTPFAADDKAYIPLGNDNTYGALNMLRVGKNDIGQLSSEFFVGFKLSNRLAIKGGLSHYFISYKGGHTDLLTGEHTTFKAYNLYNLRFIHIAYAVWQKP